MQKSFTTTVYKTAPLSSSPKKCASSKRSKSIDTNKFLRLRHCLVKQSHFSGVVIIITSPVMKNITKASITSQSTRLAIENLQINDVTSSNKSATNTYTIQLVVRYPDTALTSLLLLLCLLAPQLFRKQAPLKKVNARQPASERHSPQQVAAVAAKKKKMVPRIPSFPL